jgi:gas vesicle protein
MLNNKEKIEKVQEAAKDLFSQIIKFEKPSQITPEVLKSIKDSLEQALSRNTSEKHFQVECKVNEEDPTRINAYFIPLTKFGREILEELKNQKE